MALALPKNEEEKTIKTDNGNVANGKTEYSLESEVYYPEILIEGWSESKFVKVQNNFGDILTLESIQKEIIQMTSQKVESKQVKALFEEDAPLFPFTLRSR